MEVFMADFVVLALDVKWRLQWNRTDQETDPVWYRTLHIGKFILVQSCLLFNGSLDQLAARNDHEFLGHEKLHVPG